MPVIYTRPALGPRAYVSKTNSGWTESFPRDKADKAIREFLSPVDVGEIAKNFVDGFRLTLIERPHRSVLWDDVVSYLAGVKSCSKDMITGLIGIGFWAVVIEHAENGERAFN